MTMKTRITLRFLLWLGIYLVLMPAVFVGAMIGFGEIYEDQSEQENIYYGDFLREIAGDTTMAGDRVTVARKTESRVRRMGGWLQILDGEGGEQYRLNAPGHIPRRYAPGQLTQVKASEGEIYTWYDGDRELTWVLGISRMPERLSDQSEISGTSIRIPEHLLKEIKEKDGWVQVLDASGKEIYQFRRPPQMSKHYVPGEWVYFHKFQYKEDWHLEYWYDRREGRDWTWIYGASPKQHQLRQEFYRNASIGYFLGWVLVAVLIAFLFGRRLGGPLLHLLSWLQNLAKGDYREPTDRKGVPRSRIEGTSLLRRPYRIYRDVVEAMNRLTWNLQRSERERARLEKSREEWITGVSHDLKTPLSSVKGYADLLAAPRYQWTEEEVRQFARIVQEKSADMERLLEDLSLTFRLKNEALPLSRETVDVAELLRRSAIDLANDPVAADKEVIFEEPEADSILYPLDRNWFKRALDNLITNAALHNPPGTVIRLWVEKRGEASEKGSGVTIGIVDDGKGMDEETLEHLFERYYRGTDTERKGKGSGLGMAIAQQLIRAHGGRIWIDSEPEKGTRVTIQLPPPEKN
ncbi:sensor histidine kinase [Paludifilum halophilum]|uniref:histidine kinase n=1 Tax=Paludifilum halophilum TaxID=1642702 RepID=A0A235B3R4_9BACL|nr:HAMP domain-containing sensor histidine kinase [Paludifilum halophilum]OYD06924.1 hypothetical protein CHM34_13365 [Paludifilum halophilum]